ncbi:Ogr/Delta-like zinc finger [Methylomagnum ishizawai]|uniref:Ogr/Delta-like zinc finger n=1 Tax=Methylomagnum ishizawai TaxID=1760988 RepID=A0A1Y6D359_9GAMM|nr:ogr/Delta-like zinc finger family protein [Methylomagnum ishizawai]SMF94415.1 Ogr/Delta-like zinc finger [Methylomagnum ishizawai]
MRIVCPHCGGKAVITSRQTHTPTAADLYCQCRNTMGCGASFVYTLALKHVINPPVAITAQLAMAVIKALPAGERAKLGDLWGD